VGKDTEKVSAKHSVHRYLRKNLTRNPKKDPYIVYVCIRPGCQHYILVDLALGKLAVCNRCGREFLMNHRSVQEKRPHCDRCVRVRPKTKKKFDLANQLLEELGLGPISQDDEEDE